uniref:Phospholipase A2-like central domain-containing protein n=1 Tax=Otus sunia TaxID=257818 RepID=A0A8C8EB09_9STRI
MWGSPCGAPWGCQHSPGMGQPRVRRERGGQECSERGEGHSRRALWVPAGWLKAGGAGVSPGRALPQRQPPSWLVSTASRHDRCSAQLAALRFGYGLRGYRLRTASRCVRRRLLALNDTISNIIGVTFSNLLEVPCFVLEESRECVQRRWWGGTARAGGVSRPCLRGPRSGWQLCRATPVPAVEGRRQQGEWVLGAEHVPQPGCPGASACWRCVLGVPITFLLSSGPGRVCRCYKHPDKCKHQIPPHQVKYQLHNMDTRTLFHCNCTRRCVSRRKRQGFSHHHRVLCRYCITATRAVLEPAQHLKKTLRRWDLLHVTSKARCPEWKAQDSGGTLYMQCLQLALEQKPGAWHHMVPQ